jgi:hypothetical protein
VSDGKPRFKEASNEIKIATSFFAWNFNKRLDPISLDPFIYPLYLCYLQYLVDYIRFLCSLTRSIKVSPFED